MKVDKWRLRVLVALLACLVAVGAAQQTQEKGGTDRTGPYDPVIGWPVLPDANWEWGRV